MSRTVSVIQFEINEKQEEIKRLAAAISNIKKHIEKLKKEQENIGNKIFISDHFLQRFSERIAKLQKSEIRRIVSNTEFKKMILANGDGKYVIPSRPDCTVIVRENTLITCYANNIIDRKIAKLRRYMSYYIDCKAIQLQSEKPFPIKSFEEFDKHLNHINEKV
jgi:FtsZ-binding cell division protein ZapB